MVINDMDVGITEEDAYRILIENRGRVFYTGGSKEWKAQKPAEPYALSLPEMFWEVDEEQKLRFIHEQLEEAKTIFAVMYEGEY